MNGMFRLVVPNSVWNDVCRLYHEELAHFGVDVWYISLSNSYYIWEPGKYIQRYINICKNVRE